MVAEFNEKYTSNLEALKNWNDRLFTDMSEDEWVNLLKERSTAIRSIYEENETLLRRLNDALPKAPTELDADTAFMLKELVRNLFNGSIDDISLIVRLCRLSLSYFEKTDDHDSIVILNYILGNELTVFYRLIKDAKGVKEALNAYRKVISRADFFDLLKEPYAKIAVVNSYLNLLMFTGHFRAGDFSDCYKIFEEAISFLGSEAVINEAAKDSYLGEAVKEITSEFYSSIISCFLTLVPMQNGDREADKKKLIDRLVPVREQGMIDPESEKLFAVMTGEMTQSEWIEEKTLWLEENIPILDFSDPDIMSRMGEIIEYHNVSGSVIELLYLADIPDCEKHKYAARVIPGMMKLISEMPYTFLTEMMNSLLAEWFYIAEPFLETDREKHDMILKVFVRRQPITYIHSLMVKTIMERIGEKVIEVRPELLTGVKQCRTAAEVREKKKEVIAFLSECGLVHDVGKCVITDVINRQNRALTDDEYSLIKHHPKLGAQMAGFSGLEPYVDVILGHHKSYDGKNGYPADFDNTRSPLRFVIDLTSIADSVDAATDILGRNYTKGKDFSALFEELKQGAGTRYNPDIVKIIEENSDLYDTLSKLTSDGRFGVYHEAYREITG